MTKMILNLDIKHMAAVMKHGEANGLTFEAALHDIIESHEEARTRSESCVRPCKPVVQTVPEAKPISIQEVYAVAHGMTIGTKFSVFDAIELLPDGKVIQVTEDQMRGWGTPFSRYMEKHSDTFSLVVGSSQPRKYVRHS